MTALAANCDSVKKLSALAQLVILHGLRGTTSTKTLAEITGYSERAIRRAKAEAGPPKSGGPKWPKLPKTATRGRPPVAASKRTPVAASKRTPVAAQKEKVSPKPPLRENTTSQLLESNERAAAAATPTLRLESNAAREDAAAAALQGQIALWLPKGPDDDRAATAAWYAHRLVATHGLEIVRQAIGELTGQMLESRIDKPLTVLGKICTRLKLSPPPAYSPHRQPWRRPGKSPIEMISEARRANGRAPA